MKANSEAKSLKPIGKPATLALANLIPNPGNRAIPKDDEIKCLASSIRHVGLLYPIIVIPNEEQEGMYRIVAGERRWRAMKSLKLEAAPCVILSLKDGEVLAAIIHVVENNQRRNLGPLEEAADVRSLLDLGLEPEAVARSLGRGRAWVARRASLTELSELWLAEINNPESRIATWPPSHLEVIARFPAEVQDRMLDAYGYSWRRNLPGFRALVELTGRFLQVLSAAPWKLEDDTLCPEAGACNACIKRSSRMPDLFEGELDAGEGKTPPGDRCLDEKCWARKAEVFLSRKAGELRKEHAGLILLNNGTGEGRDDAGLEAAFETEVLNASEVAASRKSDENAVPALVVNGPGLGRIKWVQPVHAVSRNGRNETNGNSNGSGGHGAPAAPAYPLREKTLDEKKEPYDRRRRQLVIDAVRGKVTLLMDARAPDEALGLEGGPALARNGLAIKGLALLTLLLHEGGWRTDPYPAEWTVSGIPVWHDLARIRNHDLGAGDTRDVAMAMIWRLIRLALGCLKARLTPGPYEKDNTVHHLEAEILCSVLGFDLESLRAEAAKAIPYAKSWRDQVEDAWAGAKNGTGEGEELAAVGGSESQ